MHESRRYRAGFVMIVVTAAVCAAALVLRTPLRSLLWARQVIRSESMDERAAALTLLCNAGDAGRWGTESLLTSDDASARQFGVIVLQHVRSDWSRRRLVEMLDDADGAVSEAAALGLAIQGDVSVISRVKRLYIEGSDGSASAACVVLERMGAPESVAALVALTSEPAGPDRRAALVDALAGVGSREAARGLLKLLNDDRVVDAPSRADRLMERLAPLAIASGVAPKPIAGEVSASQPKRNQETVAERAAAALRRITGLTPAFSSDSSVNERRAAARVWSAWAAAPGG